MADQGPPQGRNTLENPVSRGTHGGRAMRYEGSAEPLDGSDRGDRSRGSDREWENRRATTNPPGGPKSVRHTRDPQ